MAKQLALVALVLLLLAGCRAHNPYIQLTVDPTATLQWNKNTEDDMHHYTLYNPNGEDTKITEILHPDTIVTVNVAPFVTFYYDSVFFFLTASDSNGNESGNSDTVGTIFPKYNNTLYGDVDGSGKVDVEDRSLITGLAGSIVDSSSSIEVMKCDLDANHKVDVEDVVFMDENLGARLTTTSNNDSTIHNYRSESSSLRRHESRRTNVRNQ